jgi:hypothetical protein
VTFVPESYQYEPGEGVVVPAPEGLTDIVSWYSVVYVIVWLVWDGTFIEPEAGEATYLTPEPPEIGEETLHE